MQIGDVSKQFQTLEQSLLSLVGAGTTDNYDLLSLYLTCAHDVRRIGERFDGAVASLDAKKGEATRKNAAQKEKKPEDSRTGVSETRSVISKGSPIYFVSNNDLVKIGLSKSDSERLYRKVIPLGDVESICARIAEDFERLGVVSANDLKMRSGYSDYKVQSTLMSLVSAGAMRQSGRGRYVPTEKYRSIFSAHSLMEAILDLPRHEELLRRYVVQESA